MHRFAAIATMCVLLASSHSAVADVLTIQPLGLLDFRVLNASSHAAAISPDGMIVVGNSRNARGIVDPILWSQAGGLISLGNPSGRSSYATGVAVTPAGETVVAGNVGAIARRWSSNTGSWQALPPTSLCTTSLANSLTLSTDGSEAWVAGWSDVRGGCGGHLYNGGYRYRWSTHTYEVAEQTTAKQCDFWAVAADGTAVGRMVIPGLGDRAVYWNASGSPQCIAPMAGLIAQARDISSDTGTIVGEVYRDGSTHAFLYRMGESTYIDLGTLPGDATSVAATVSADGAVVGGSSTSTARPPMTASLATVWDAGGQHSLWDLLTTGGADLAGWQALNGVTSISADGRTVCGDGWYDFDGDGPDSAVATGFVATIPEPAGGLLAAVTLAAAAPRKRRRHGPSAASR